MQIARDGCDRRLQVNCSRRFCLKMQQNKEAGGNIMSRLFHITFVLFLLVPTAIVLAQDEAAEVDPKYTWDLTELYPSVEAWEQARDEVLASFDEIEARRGTLGDSADSLYQALALISDSSREAARVFAEADGRTGRDG